MAITVIDAMNAMGHDWECSEVLRAEVRRLIDAREERERHYQSEWQSLRADLTAAEQRATDAETALRDIIEIHRRHPGDTPLRMVDRASAALAAPATQSDERAAARGAALLYVHLVASEGITGDYIFTEAERIARLLDATDGARTGGDAMTSDEFATSIGGIAMESDRINEVGCHVPVVVDKLFGPLIFRKLRVTAMFDGCYWLIERETGPENEWVEWCRIPGQLDIDFDKEATP